MKENAQTGDRWWPPLLAVHAHLDGMCGWGDIVTWGKMSHIAREGNFPCLPLGMLSLLPEAKEDALCSLDIARRVLLC
jgi:hypothetical protein